MPWGIVVAAVCFVAISILFRAFQKQNELAKENDEIKRKEARQKWIDAHTNRDIESACHAEVSNSLVSCACTIDAVGSAISSVGCDISNRVEWARWEWFMVEYGSIYALAEKGLIPYRMAVGLFRIGENGRNEKTAAEIFVMKSINKRLIESGYSSLKYKPIGPVVEYLVKDSGEQDIEKVDPWEYKNVSALIYPSEASPPYMT